MSYDEKSDISLRLPARTVEAFDRIAQVLDRDRSWVMWKALDQYLAKRRCRNSARCPWPR
ncbi:CopG family ribbon-helix-helix protein [Rhizobium beringeri]